MVIREVKQQTLFSNQYLFTLDYSYHAAAAAALHSPVVHPSHLGIVPSRLSVSAFVFFVVLLLTSLDVVSCDETTVAPPPALTSTTAAPTVRTPAPTVAPNSTSTTSAPSSVIDLQPSASSNPIVLSIVGSVSGVIIFSAGGWLYYRISKSPSEVEQSYCPIDCR
ncbi:membrane-associated protein, putative [Bodo saltans]|uniref:Membrane-associated protein, putative n=1 Tax=Bodo saltans TaxID=75058 RepID=A0A0S4ITR5_BODSA|nr:membrane-associated protein, putative [Bodo saltans]|eukprot:CUF89042.1 membrane-associated protein, putative [Bodo saltans]